MTIEEKFKVLENEYTHLAGKYHMMQAGYNARLKADMVAMLTELHLEIEEMPMYYDPSDVSDIIQQKINLLKENKDGRI